MMKFLPFVRRFALGDGDEDDDDDAERNCGFSYGKLTRDRFDPTLVVVVFRVLFPLIGGESK